MGQDVEEPELLEPEILDSGPRGHPGFFQRLEMAFGPIVAGVLIDALDVATFGRFGMMLGMLIGGSAAYWMCSIYRLPVLHRFLWALAAGLYCSVPRTELIPVATLIGAFARFVQSGRRR